MKKPDLAVLAAYNDLVDLLDDQGMAFAPALKQAAHVHKLTMKQRLALVKYHDDKLKPTEFAPHEPSITRYGK